MRHPSDGTLRRLLDEPIGVADSDVEHVIGCSTCRAELAEAQEDAAFAASALAVEMELDVDAAWERFSHAFAAEAPVAPVARPRRRRFSLRGQTAATLGVAALLAGAGVAAAADWLQIFSTQEVTPVAINQADLLALPDLSAYGELEVIKEPNVRSVKDARSAAEMTGLTVPQVRALPRGVQGAPAYQAGEQGAAVFTFSAAKARAAVDRSLPTPPAGLDGERFRLVVGPGVATVWPGNSGLPALLVGRATGPKVFSTGVPFDTAREYLLSLPGLPADVAAQLRRFSGAEGALPLPIPADQLTTSTSEVNGSSATVFRSRDGALTGVTWVRDGLVNLVAGTLSEDEVLSVARGLR